MIIKLVLGDTDAECSLKVIKEPTDKRYTRGYSLPESGLLYDVKRKLNEMGFDMIKKRMWKDGHMVDDLQQYVRCRSLKSPRKARKAFCVYNSAWAIRDAGEVYNGIKPYDFITLDVCLLTN